MTFLPSESFSLKILFLSRESEDVVVPFLIPTSESLSGGHGTCSFHFPSHLGLQLVSLSLPVYPHWLICPLIVGTKPQTSVLEKQFFSNIYLVVLTGNTFWVQEKGLHTHSLLVDWKEEGSYHLGPQLKKLQGLYACKTVLRQVGNSEA